MYRGAVVAYDALWVNWATLSLPGTVLSAEVSPAQQLLNRRANEDALGQDDTATWQP